MIKLISTSLTLFCEVSNELGKDSVLNESFLPPNLSYTRIDVKKIPISFLVKVIVSIKPLRMIFEGEGIECVQDLEELYI